VAGQSSIPAHIRIGSRYKETCYNLVTLDGHEIQWANTVRYLGVYLASAKMFTCATDNANKSFYPSLNSIFGKISFGGAKKKSGRAVQPHTVMYEAAAAPKATTLITTTTTIATTATSTTTVLRGSVGTSYIYIVAVLLDRLWWLSVLVLTAINEDAMLPLSLPLLLLLLLLLVLLPLSLTLLLLY